MKRLILTCISVVLGASGLLPVQHAQADPKNPCFAADPGVGQESKTDHYKWAQTQSTDALANNFAGKVAMVFNCDAVSDYQADRAFGEISALIARREPDVNCFGGDQGAVSTDAAKHESWASSRSRAEIRDNLAWKASAAIKCLGTGNKRDDLFAEASLFLARVPGGVGPADSGNCNSGQYSLSGHPPTRPGATIGVNYTAPQNHSARDWIGIFPEFVVPAQGRFLSWKYLTDPCGYVYLTAPMEPGRYAMYLLADDGYTPIGGAVPLVVNPS